MRVTEFMRAGHYPNAMNRFLVSNPQEVLFVT